MSNEYKHPNENRDIDEIAEQWIRLVLEHIQHKRKFQDIGSDVRKNISIKSEHEN